MKTATIIGVIGAAILFLSELAAMIMDLEYYQFDPGMIIFDLTVIFAYFTLLYFLLTFYNRLKR